MDKRLEDFSNEELIKAVIEKSVMEVGYINKALLSDIDIQNIVDKVYGNNSYVYDIFVEVDDEISDNYIEEEENKEENKEEEFNWASCGSPNEYFGVYKLYEDNEED